MADPKDYDFDVSRLDNYLKRKLVAFHGYDRYNETKPPFVLNEMKIEAEFETIEDLANIIKGFDHYLFDGHIYVKNDGFPCALCLDAIFNYNEVAVSIEADDAAIALSDEMCDAISKWIKDHPIKFLYSDHSRVGSMGDYTYDVEDQDHYYKRLKELCGEEK
jgi:hypothetical protein